MRRRCSFICHLYLWLKCPTSCYCPLPVNIKTCISIQFEFVFHLYFAYISTQFVLAFYLYFALFQLTLYLYFICIFPMIGTVLSDRHQAAGCYSWLAGFSIKIFIFIFFVFLSGLFRICVVLQLCCMVGCCIISVLYLCCTILYFGIEIFFLIAATFHRHCCHDAVAQLANVQL